MARDRTSIVKQSRREGYALHPKAHKYLIKKSGLPGQHPARAGRRGKPSQYSVQLREKQKMRRIYGLLEKQFANLFKKAMKKTGQTGNTALSLLERRLDNAVYRIGFAHSRPSARQLVSHKHFLVNDRVVNIASITLKVGDIIKVKPKSIKNEYFKNLDDLSPAPSQMPSWIKVDRKKLSFEVTSNPMREDTSEEINEQLVIEYYSR